MMRAPWRPASARAALPSAGLLLASAGGPFSPAAITEAARLANGARIRVVTVARIHGSSFGLQHPGLMPNKRERDQAQAFVSKAIGALQRAGLKADGEVVITRSPGRSFVRAARAAGVRQVLVDAPPAGPSGRLEAWLTARYLRYRLRDIALAVVAPASD